MVLLAEVSTRGRAIGCAPVIVAATVVVATIVVRTAVIMWATVVTWATVIIAAAVPIIVAATAVILVAASVAAAFRITTITTATTTTFARAATIARLVAAARIIRTAVSTLGRAEVAARSWGTSTSTTSLFQSQSLALELGAKESRDGCVCVFASLHCHEAEATRFAGVWVVHDGGFGDATVFGEKFLKRTVVDARAQPRNMQVVAGVGRAVRATGRRSTSTTRAARARATRRGR